MIPAILITARVLKTQWNRSASDIKLTGGCLDSILIAEAKAGSFPKVDIGSTMPPGEIYAIPRLLHS